jgi:hypothetical protein
MTFVGAEMAEQISSSPFACDMSAIEPEQRSQHIAAIKELFQTVQEVQELPNGYAFRMPNETGLLMRTAEFVAREKLCCPFFGFKIEIEPNNGGLWLHLTGRDGVKPFIAAEIGNNLRKTVAIHR